MKTWAHQSPSDTPFWSRVEFQAGYTQLMHSTGANVSMMVLQGCKSTPQKSRPIESGHGRHAVQVANVCSYKLGQKMNFNFEVYNTLYLFQPLGSLGRIVENFPQ